MTSINGGQIAGNRNRIINGAMMIDQRNAGASGTTTNVYTVDRWQYGASQASKGTWGQNLNAVTPPLGFSNYLGFQSSSSYTVAAGDYFYMCQPIEGVNVADLGFGAASGKSVTLSFWVYSSLTGTFGGSLINAAANRTYPFTYSIGVASTWTYISVTIAADTTGTWPTTTARWGSVLFSLGAGSTYSGTAGAWAASSVVTATGAVSVVGTSSATFYITGVQLEPGSTATLYEWRNYSEELRMCQRYYELLDGGFSAYCATTTIARAGVSFKVTKRAAPTLDKQIVTSTYVNYTGGNPVFTSYTLNAATVDGMYVDFVTAGTFTAGAGCTAYIPANSFSVSAEL